MAAVLGPPPFTIGWDVAGTVDAVGMGVTRFSVGDAVFGMPWFPRQAGAYAEFVTAPSRHFAHRPARLSALEAAGLPLARPSPRRAHGLEARGPAGQPGLGNQGAAC